MILPGWGQLYKGDKTKGKVLLTLWSLGIVGSVTSHLARENAEDKYLSEPIVLKSSRGIKHLTRFINWNNLLIFSAAIWIYSYIDAVLTARPLKKVVSPYQESFLSFP